MLALFKGDQWRLLIYYLALNVYLAFMDLQDPRRLQLRKYLGANKQKIIKQQTIWPSLFTEDAQLAQSKKQRK